MIATASLDYRIPTELIAQTPSERRDGSRLLVVDRATRRIEHRVFSDLPSYLRAGDILIRNNASVLPARLQGRRPMGGRIECLLLRRTASPRDGGETWQCLVRPGRKLPKGATFGAIDGAFSAEVTASLEDGSVLVKFSTRGRGTRGRGGKPGRGDPPAPLHRPG